MIRALLTLLLLAGPALAADAPTVRLETEVPEATWAGVPVPVTLRVLVDLEAFEASSVTLFPRAMDLQLKLTAPWAAGAPEDPPAGTDALSLVLNDRVVSLRRADDRDGLAVLEARWTFHPEEPGSLDLAAPTFEFAWATEFEDDFVSGRRPLDRHPAAGTGEPRTVEVRALPEAGRPEGFSGAVGDFSVRASAEPAELAVGEELTLTLRITGTGNLARFDTPSVAPDGFHVLGRIDDRASPERTVAYDLTPTRGGIDTIGAIPFAFFDPEAGSYRTVSTAPVPVVVTSTGPEEALTVEEDESGFPWPVALVLVVVLLGLAALGRRMRRGTCEPEAPSPADVFHERAPTDLTGALTEFLATVLACSPSAVISPDLADRLVAAGVDRDRAEKAGALMEGLVGARYGGESGGDELRRATELVDGMDLK